MTSTDSDGTISSYAWSFGDGATATGATPLPHTYAAAGTYGVTLTVTDDDGATNSVAHDVTVIDPPEAAFTTQVTDLDVTVDGTTSSDSDGTIASYAWTFGDGGTANGATPAKHSYAAAGTYNITLTVTDDDGGIDSVTHSVSVTPAVPPGPTPFGIDEFGRTLASTWGSAELGGAWTLAGSAANYSVVDGVGKIRMGSAGAGPEATLGAVLSTNTEMRYEQSLDKIATGGGTYLIATPRRVDGANQYYAKVRYQANGTAQVILGRIASGSDAPLQTVNLGLTVSAGDKLNVKVQAFGTAPTTLRAKVWIVGQPEPSGWVGSVTDNTAALQVAGALSLKAYLSGSSTNAPVVASFDHFWAGPAV